MSSGDYRVTEDSRSDGSARSTEVTENRLESNRGLTSHPVNQDSYSPCWLPIRATEIMVPSVSSHLHHMSAKTSIELLKTQQQIAYETFRYVAGQNKTEGDIEFSPAKQSDNQKDANESTNYEINKKQERKGSSNEGKTYHNHSLKRRYSSEPEDLTVQANAGSNLSREPCHKKYKSFGFGYLPGNNSISENEVPHIPALFSILSPSLKPMMQSVAPSLDLGVIPQNQTSDSIWYSNQYSSLLQNMLLNPQAFLATGFQIPHLPFLQCQANVTVDSPPVTPHSPQATSSKSDDIPATIISASPRGFSMEHKSSERGIHAHKELPKQETSLETNSESCKSKLKIPTSVYHSPSKGNVSYPLCKTSNNPFKFIENFNKAEPSSVEEKLQSKQTFKPEFFSEKTAQSRSKDLPKPFSKQIPTSTEKYKNYKNMTRKKRIEANARERTRVHTISSAYDRLRRAVPSYSNTQKLSKLSLLKIAASYISTLSKMTEESPESELLSSVENTTKVIQSNAESKKKKNG